MKPWAGYGLAALAGAALILAVNHSHLRVVHAQAMYAPGCVTSVPKTWGSFHGISEDGMAFEDAEGTIRVISHPICGNGLPSSVTPRVDLEIRRP